MLYQKIGDSLVVCGDSKSKEVKECIDAQYGIGQIDFIPKFKLIICDPPYGKIVDEKWDKNLADYEGWFAHCNEVSAISSTIIMWGGVGKHRERQFLKWVSTVEDHYPQWEGSFCTWAKKRAYGIPDDYLFCREEAFILYKGPRGKTGMPPFNIPLLETKRGYEGYNKEYPAKSEFLRRTNVWTDITELFKGKIHPTQKPDALYEMLINTHSNEGDTVYDPCAGSGTTARAAVKTGRNYCIVEVLREYLEKANLM